MDNHEFHESIIIFSPEIGTGIGIEGEIFLAFLVVLPDIQAVTLILSICEQNTKI